MGLSNHLCDASSDSIPILLVAAAAGWVSYLRSLLLCLVSLLHPSSAADPGVPDASAAVGSGLAGLVALADHLRANRPFPLDPAAAAAGTPPDAAADCAVCLSRLSGGDRVRRLPCRHVFHSECLDGWWIDHRSGLSCPLCRSPMAAAAGDAERRIGAELVAWLSPY